MSHLLLDWILIRRGSPGIDTTKWGIVYPITIRPLLHRLWTSIPRPSKEAAETSWKSIVKEVLLVFILVKAWDKGMMLTVRDLTALRCRIWSSRANWKEMATGIKSPQMMWPINISSKETPTATWGLDQTPNLKCKPEMNPRNLDCRLSGAICSYRLWLHPPAWLDSQRDWTT